MKFDRLLYLEIILIYFIIHHPYAFLLTFLNEMKLQMNLFEFIVIKKKKNQHFLEASFFFFGERKSF